MPNKKYISSPNQVLAVEASAGSGKTYALAKRYIELLLNPAYAKNTIPLKNILAITFTNKATIEMKYRILEMLKKIALDKFNDDKEREDIMGATGLKADAAKVKASEAIECIIRNYNYYKVQTIDSFVNEILSGCALKLGLSAGFEISENSEDYLAYALDELTEKAGKDAALRKLFGEFITHYLASSDKPGWFPRDNMHGMLKKLYDANNTYGKEIKKLAGGIDQLELRKSICARISKIYKTVAKEDGLDKRCGIALEKFSMFEDEFFKFEGLSAYFKRDCIPFKKGCGVPKNLEVEWSALRGELKKLCEAESYTYYNSYPDMYEKAIGILRGEAEKDDTLFLNELNRQANRLIGEGHIDVPELYYRLATRFHHYLIDEFQDTSDIQWQNIEPMAEEALANGGTLFFVGDKKQAIFEFRGGNTRLFGSVAEKFKKFGSRTEPLLTNYRSCQEIIDFNNGFFSPENLRRFVEAIYINDEDRTPGLLKSDAEDVLEVFREARQTPKAGCAHGYVRAEYLDGDNKEERAEIMKKKLVELVKELLERCPPGDIAILARENDDLAECAEWLIENGVAVETDRTLNIKGNRYVKELVSLLRFLHSPIDNSAFASFITGSIFTKAAGLKPAAIESTIFKAGNDKVNRDYLYIIFREKFKTEWDSLLEEPYRNVGHVPLYELTVGILEKFKVAVNFPDSRRFTLKLLELIKEREKECDDIGAFLDYFDEAQDEDLFISAYGGDAVKLMSIHKSKGLQFPVVIIPYLELQTTPTEKHGPYLKETNGGLALMRLKKEYQFYSEKIARIMAEKEKGELIGELDVIYVALTRAQRELRVFIPNKVKNSDNLIRVLITEAETEKGTPPAKYEKKQEKGMKKYELRAPEYADMASLLKDEMPAEGELEDRKKFIIGDQAHAALKLIGSLAEDYEVVLKNAAKLAAEDFPEGRTEAELFSVLKGLVEDKDLKRFFFTEAVVRNEQEIILGSGETKRVDRLLIGKDTATVIDYKSTRQNAESDIRQVRQYVGAAKEIFTGKQVEGYVIYLDEKKAEKVGQA
jgi:ATP-dependent helicase/nuclease subunit A